MTATIAQPTTAQLVAAFASSLLPLAGPTGIAVASLIPAAEQLLESFRNHGKTDFTVEDLIGIVSEGRTELATLRANVEAQEKAEAEKNRT
jgi:hypothetical protein